MVHILYMCYVCVYGFILFLGKAAFLSLKLVFQFAVFKKVFPEPLEQDEVYGTVSFPLLPSILPLGSQILCEIYIRT